MLHPIGLVLDCHDPQELAAFWSEALGYVNLGEAGSYVLLMDGDGQGPKLLLQAVPEAKAGKNRMHLDIDAVDIEAEAARLEALGARRVAQVHTWWVLEAPTGHRFCVVKPQRGPLGDDANTWK